MHGKLTEGEQLVQKSIELLGARGGKDSDDLRRSLQALKLNELEVDVESFKIPLQQELTTLRSAVDNGGVQNTNAPPPVPMLPLAGTGSGPVGSSQVDLEKIKKLEVDIKALRETSQGDADKLKRLETENRTLRDQLKDVESRLAASNEAISKANGNASDLANSEIKSLKSQVDALKRDVSAKEAQNAEKEAALERHTATISTLKNEAQSKQASDSTKEQTLRAEADKARSDAQQLEAKMAAANKDFEAKLAVTTKEWEARVAAKTQELARVGDEKQKALQEQEARLEAEKEEMMEAMAQEIEVSTHLVYILSTCYYNLLFFYILAGN